MTLDPSKSTATSTDETGLVQIPPVPHPLTLSNLPRFRFDLDAFDACQGKPLEILRTYSAIFPKAASSRGDRFFAQGETGEAFQALLRSRGIRPRSSDVKRRR